MIEPKCDMWRGLLVKYRDWEGKKGVSNYSYFVYTLVFYKP